MPLKTNCMKLRSFLSVLIHTIEFVQICAECKNERVPLRLLWKEKPPSCSYRPSLPFHNSIISIFFSPKPRKCGDSWALVRSKIDILDSISCTILRFVHKMDCTGFKQQIWLCSVCTIVKNRQSGFGSGEISFLAPPPPLAAIPSHFVRDRQDRLASLSVCGSPALSIILVAPPARLKSLPIYWAEAVVCSKIFFWGEVSFFSFALWWTLLHFLYGGSLWPVQ